METTTKDALKFLKENICEDVKLPNAEGMSNKANFYMASKIMTAFAMQQTTSQNQTIDRLREELLESNRVLNSLRLSMSAHPDNEPDSEFRYLLSLAYDQTIKVQQLLNTTEPNQDGKH